MGGEHGVELEVHMRLFIDCIHDDDYLHLHSRNTGVGLFGRTLASIREIYIDQLHLSFLQSIEPKLSDGGRHQFRGIFSFRTSSS